MTSTAMSARKQIAEIASDILNGDADVMEGCRKIVFLRGSLDMPETLDPDLLVVVAIESELDDVPVGPARKQWAPEALADKDKEMFEYLEMVRPELLRACQSIANRWLPDNQRHVLPLSKPTLS